MYARYFKLFLVRGFHAVIVRLFKELPIGEIYFFLTFFYLLINPLNTCSIEVCAMESIVRGYNRRILLMSGEKIVSLKLLNGKSMIFERNFQPGTFFCFG